MRRYLVSLTLIALAAHSLVARTYFRPYTSHSLQKWSPRPVRDSKRPTIEHNAPSLASKGEPARPIAHAIEERETPSFYVTAHTDVWTRDAHKAFTDKHGTAKQPLSGLVFGKSDFRLSQIFQDCYVPRSSENYNPYMRILKMHPRVSYHEMGLNMNITVETRMKKFKNTRVGVRVKAPLMRREMERKDAGWRSSEQTQDVFTQQNKVVKGSGTASSDQTVQAYRLDYLEATKQTPSGKSMVTYEDQNIQIAGSSLARDTSGEIAGAFIYSPEGTVPRSKSITPYNLELGETNSSITNNLPVDLTTVQEGKIYQASNTTDYSTLSDKKAETVSERITRQDSKANIWVVPTFTSYTLGGPEQHNEELFSAMDASKRDLYSNQYEWLYDRGYLLTSDSQTGIGNTTLEFYVAHDISEKGSFELTGGIVAPTGTGALRAHNPYLTHLGNRGHLEAFGGGSFVWRPFSWAQLSAHGQYHTVLSAQEYRTATPTGALVKNIGPETTADVKWQYACASTELTLIPPKTRTVSLTFGYDFYYKTKDTISFTQTTVESWLGKKYSSSDLDYTKENNWTLDASVAAIATESFAHTARLQANFSYSRLMHVYASGAYTLAGKNTPQDLEMSFGCSITF